MEVHKVKAIISLLALALLTAGCATSRQVSTMQGKGTKHVFRAPYDQVWRASVDAAQMGELEVVNADRSRGYISSKRGLQVETFGENVGIWVTSLSPTETQVEVISRQAGPPKFWLKNWEDEILRTIEANLTREAVAAMGGTPVPSDTITGTRAREETRQELERRLAELRKDEEMKHDQLVREQSTRDRQQLQREVDEMRSELRRLQDRLEAEERKQP
jgi:hypothetical protein